MSEGIFYKRRLVIATMHGKEQVIAPLLQEYLGVEIVAATGLNTDQFGTFTGEVERDVDPVEAARSKCRIACREYNCTLAVASEGSFGPHPGLFFVPADDEILVLLDLENGLEIKARELTTKTNFGGALFHSWNDVKKFAVSKLFPGHGLIIREKHGCCENMTKGIRSWKELERLVARHLGQHKQVYVETDMRAMNNPTRMKVIEQAAQKLIAAAQRLCPQCNMPGFDVTDAVQGLPCSQCGTPTRSTLALIYTCQKCACRKEQKYPGGKTTEEPMYCDWCNP